MVQRLVHRHRHTYNTRSNKTKIVKTPGGSLVYQYRTKKAGAPKCGDCGHALHGIPALRPKEYSRLKKSQRTVSRAYGGSRCSACVKARVLRAFLCEERKLVKKVLKDKMNSADSQESEKTAQATEFKTNFTSDNANVASKKKEAGKK
jgi:large subunit ribosomal protein L34e